MSRSVPAHRLPKALFHRAMLRNLRLPLYDLANPPRCWCGKWHDPYGDHIFQCVVNNKKMPHNFVCDGQQQHMQLILVTAGYIRSGTKLRRDTPGLVDSNKDLRPLAVSFSIDQSPDAEAAATCPFDEVGWDATIVRPPPDCPIPDPADVISTVTANADQHLQRYKWGKLMRLGAKDDVTGATVLGDHLIGEDAKNAVLIPFAIDHVGRIGHIARRFFF
ncbi:hypothetical protein ACHAWF_007330, partial [Thalassiosira exigua]